MPSVKRSAGARGRPSEGAREALIAAATALFVERDYDDVSTDEILEHAGVSKGALYHHFPGKVDLFRAVFEESEQRVLARLASVAVTANGPFDALRMIAFAYLRECETNRELQRIGLLQSRAVLGWEGWREVASELGLGVSRALIVAAMDAGELKRFDPDAAAHILLAPFIEAALLIVTAKDREATRKRCEAILLEQLEALRVR